MRICRRAHVHPPLSAPAPAAPGIQIGNLHDLANQPASQPWRTCPPRVARASAAAVSPSYLCRVNCATRNNSLVCEFGRLASDWAFNPNDFFVCTLSDQSGFVSQFQPRVIKKEPSGLSPSDRNGCATLQSQRISAGALKSASLLHGGGASQL